MNNTKTNIKYFVVLLITCILIGLFNESELLSKPQKKATPKAKTTQVKSTKTKKTSKTRLTSKSKSRVKTVSKTKSKLKTKSKSRSKKSKLKVAKVPVLKEESTIEVTSIDTLAPGVFYKKLLIGDARLKYYVHLVEADMKDPLNKIAIMKANNQISEVEKLQRINHHYDSLHTDRQLLASVNANFWKAYSNYPIGPVIINGEIVEMNSYKNWSSAFFDSRNRMYIDRFSISGTVSSRKGLFVNIDAVNRRLDSTQIVVYNQYGGDSIPFIPQKSVSKALDVALQDIDLRDSTDLEIDTLEVKKQLQSARRMETVEYNMPKLTLKYLTPPAINKNITCVVLSLDSFAVKTSSKTCILSLGKQFPSYKIPKIGDTLTLRYETNVMGNTIFTDAVSGTPRLVRNGVAEHEANIEGSRARRFISSPLPRTAIGTNREMNKTYMVVVESSNSTKKTSGASLAELAKIMKMVGCHNAMNLDGGGSTILAIDEQNQLFPNNPDLCRRLSVGFALIRKEKNKYMRSIQNSDEIK